MADLSHISTDGTLPDGAYVANGTGDGNVKSLQSMTETSVRQSLRAGVDDSFGFAKDGLFGVLLRSIGGILSGAVELGAGALSWVVDGVVGLIDGVARAIGNLFGGSSGGQVNPPQPPPSIFNPIKTNLEQVLAPKFEEVDRLSAGSTALGEQIEQLQDDYDEKLGDQGVITESISKLSGDLAKKVDGSSFTQYEQGMEEKLWGENGELWRLNSVLWDEQDGWNATQQKLNETQDEINRLNDERNDLQDQVSALNTQMLESQSEFISRVLVASKERIVEDDYLHVQPSGSRLLVTAKENSVHGAWTGEVLMQSAYPTGGATYAPVTEFTTIPTGDAGNQRFKNWPGGGHNLPVFQYWVRQAVHRQNNQTLGWYTTPYNEWLTRPELTFTAPIAASYSIYYRVVWDGTTYNDDYSFRVLKNGETLFQWGPMTHVGPMFPGPNVSGRRVRTINELDVRLEAEDVLTFQTWSNAGRESQRSVESSERKISWMMPFGSTWSLDSDGEGGFLRLDGFDGVIEWNWQNSVRFLVSDVVAGTALEVWDGTAYNTAPAGTVISLGAWIRSAEPHPSSVTFRKRN